MPNFSLIENFDDFRLSVNLKPTTETLFGEEKRTLNLNYWRHSSRGPFHPRVMLLQIAFRPDFSHGYTREHFPMKIGKTSAGEEWEIFD